MTIIELYKDFDTIYGPYTAKDGRKKIILYSKVTRRRKTVSYPKALYESHIGRILVGDETVDHINGDFTDDRIENLQILTRAENAKKSAVEVDNNKTKFICSMCNTVFTPTNTQRAKRQLKAAGPFCSKSCTGKYGAGLQNGKINKKDFVGERKVFYKN